MSGNQRPADAPGAEAGTASEQSPRPRIFAATARDRPPFPVEAVVIEQDCDLLLDTEPVLREPRESLETLLRAAKRAHPETPGTVLVRGNTAPYYFLAIVHDFSVTPSWKEEWVAMALAAVFREAGARHLKAIGMPLLGTVHGRLDRRRSIALLTDCLQGIGSTELENIWLLVPSQHGPHLIQPLLDDGYDVTRLHGGGSTAP